ncbi:hypothetical protein INR49_018448 [Caranx melampygus]|nr:hypothetical protein INR49_018448 [Caranx melampygus]
MTLRGGGGGLFPTGSHEYEVFRFALAQHQDIPKLVPQVDMSPQTVRCRSVKVPPSICPPAFSPSRVDESFL